MQIIKIYPKNKAKAHFSIRTFNDKYYVFEGDKMLRKDLLKLEHAESEITLIILARKKLIVEVEASYFINHAVSKSINVLEKDDNKTNIKNCLNCNEAYHDKTNRKKYCNVKCATKYNNDRRIEKIKAKPDMTKECLVCSKQFKPSRISHYCCSQGCSSINYQIKKKAIQEIKEEEPSFLSTENSHNLQNDTIRLLREEALFNKIKEDDKTNNPDSFENGILNAPKNMGIPEPMKEDLNEFHELTDKEMRLSLRKKKVDGIAWDIVNYVIACSEINVAEPFKIYEDLINYNLVDLTRSQISNVFSNLTTFHEGVFIFKPNINYDNYEIHLTLQQALSEKIFKENAIPTQEQYTKGAVIRLMTSQLRFFLSERKRLKQEKPQPISNVFETGIFQGLMDMIQNLSNQNKIISQAIDQCLENNILQSTQLKSISISQLEAESSKVKNILDLNIRIDDLLKRVTQLSEKRKRFLF